MWYFEDIDIFIIYVKLFYRIEWMSYDLKWCGKLVVKIIYYKGYRV